MTDALEKILKESALSDNTKAAIAEAWETKLQIAREELTANLRNDFAINFEKDKKIYNNLYFGSIFNSLNYSKSL